MGREARCTARFGAQVSEGKALLETDEVAFRGDFRLRIPFALAAGLVDVKVARFSASHSALKLVIPRARRPG